MSDDRSEPMDLERLLSRIDDIVLESPRKYTGEQAAELAGLSIDEARRLWRSLGFAVATAGEIVYTEADVDAMRLVQTLEAQGVDDAELRSSMTRFFGQTYSRLASMEGQLIVGFLAEHPELLTSDKGVSALLDTALPVLEKIQGYVWRRQLASYLTRATSNLVGAGDSDVQHLAVGFADLKGFTTLTQQVSERELTGVLESFEATAGDVVAQCHGRVIKTIGDEVLFTAQNIESGAEIALQLLESTALNDDIPDLRIGLAAGPVVQRMGDVYGATVNIASRLTKICRPGNVLINKEAHDALEDDKRYELKSLRPVEVRGYSRLYSWRLRRAVASERD